MIYLYNYTLCKLIYIYVYIYIDIINIILFYIKLSVKKRIYIYISATVPATLGAHDVERSGAPMLANLPNLSLGPLGLLYS